jgi:allene oxide cyclase
MRNRLALATVLTVLVSGALVASMMAAAASPGSSSSLRPWGTGRPAAEPAAAQATTPAGTTRLVVIAREVDFTIVDVGPQGDSPGDTIAFTDDLFDQAGRRIGRDQAHCTIMFRGDVLCDASFVIAGRGQLIIHGVGLTFAVTGGTGDFQKARGQLHETFLPTGEFRFAFTLHL